MECWNGGNPTHTHTPRPHAAASLCSLLFALVPAIKEPLLGLAQQQAELLALGAHADWQRARCVAQIFEAISASFNYYRKQQLVQWALALQRRLHAGVASHCELDGAEGGQAQGTERPGTPHPAPRARA